MIMINKITLSGFAGTGKSTVGKIIEKELGFKFISVGNYTRDFAEKEFGLNINEFQEKCKNEPELDKLIDEKFKAECNSKSKLVIDYRLGFKFIENSFNVFLKVSDEEAALRIKRANRTGENISHASINERNSKMKMRFIDNYNVDFTNETNYHICIDTDNLSPEQVSELIIKAFIEYESN
jgi:predicted cytidylate kinase